MARRKGVKKKVASKRERRFVEGVASGKTDKQAALDAGFTISMAEATKARIWSKPEVQDYFRELMQKAAPPQRVIKKISEHIDGKSITTRIRKRTVPSTDPKKGGEEVEETVVEKIETIDAGVSLKAIEMAIEIGEYMPPKGTPNVGVGVSVTLEQAMIKAGQEWLPPTWARPLKDLTASEKASA